MKVRETTWALAVAVALSIAAANAQDQPQSTQQTGSSAPIQPLNSGLGPGYSKPPAAAGRGFSPEYDPQPYDLSQVTPDQNTLAGAEYFGLGSLSHAHSIFDPSLSFSQMGESYGGAPGQSSLGSVTLLGGGLNFNHTWSRYQFDAIYNGGESLNRGFLGNANYPFNNLTLKQAVEWQRWHLILRDDFSSSPFAAFTGAGMGGPGLLAQYSSVLATSLGSYGQAFLPSETIETGYATRYMNSVLGQAEYSLSRTSTLTFAASYGLLDFNQTGYVSNHMLNAQAGYDYQLDPKNSLAILGGYGKIDFAGTANFTTDYMGALAYGRKITGRMSFQASVGPQLIHSIGAPGNFQLWLLSVNSTLSYAWRRSSVSFSIVRGLNSGSGVLMGASSDTFTLFGTRQFTRFWTGTLSGGYALNNSLAPAGAATSQFDDWFVGANIGRQLGRHAVVNFNYGLWRSTSPSVCPVTSCGFSGSQQTFGMTINWHLRPAG
jgi:hypothetical protein